METLAYVHALCALRPRVSALRLQALVDAATSAATAWNAADALLDRAAWTPDAKTFFREHRARWDVAAEWTRLTRSGIRLVPRDEPEFPRLLRAIYDPPVALYVRGTLRPDERTVAIVGSRKATPYGRTVAQMLARPLASRGITIVSGLAYGIDAEAHRATLAVHGRTVAVLGGGVDDQALYPRAHRTLAEEICAHGGGVISEFAPGTEPRPELFPQRNRLIAGMSHAVVVVEAATDSGALITARLALNENREVLAVPGPITSPVSAGANRLLREGAAPALSADDVLEALALEDILVAAPRAQGTDDRGPADPSPVGAVLSSLSTTPTPIDALVASGTLPLHEVAAALSVLELEGRARDVGGKQYVRC